MNIKELIVQQTAYNVWANTCIAELLKTLDDSILNKEQVSSFPSIKKTINHIWDAEFIWLTRLKEEPITDWPSKLLPSNSPIDAFLKTSIEFNLFVKSKHETFFDSNTTYFNLKKEAFSTKNSGITLHCMNHSTFHRGQIVTMLRNCGITKLPSTDLITYLREA